MLVTFTVQSALPVNFWKLCPPDESMKSTFEPKVSLVVVPDAGGGKFAVKAR